MRLHCCAQVQRPRSTRGALGAVSADVDALTHGQVNGLCRVLDGREKLNGWVNGCAVLLGHIRPQRAWWAPDGAG